MPMVWKTKKKEIMMEIVKGVQPNCSELAIYLDDEKVEDILEVLKKYGIEEYLLNNHFSYYANEEEKNKKTSDWDCGQPGEKFIKLSDLPKRLLNKILKWKNDKASKKEIKIIQKELKEIGINIDYCAIELLDKNDLVDYENTGVSLISQSDNGPMIMGGSDCNKKIFPLLYKISSVIKKEVHGYDGGHLTIYEDWVAAGCPDPNSWSWGADEEEINE